MACSPEAVHLMRELLNIPLHRRDGTVAAIALIDVADSRLLVRRWYLGRGKVVAKTSRRDGQRTLLLHREVLGLDPGHVCIVDHINGNPLDNRRANLRVATASENAQNRTRPHARNTSGHRGVVWDRAHGAWRAGAQLNGRQYFLGLFDDAALAGAAAAAWRAEHMPFSPDARKAA